MKILNENEDDNFDLIVSYDDIINRKVPMGKYQIIFILIQGIYIENLLIKFLFFKGLFFFVFANQLIITSLLIDYLRENYKLSNLLSNFTGSSVFIGLIIGSIFSGKFEKCYGRRICLIASASIIFILLNDNGICQ